MKRTEKEWQQIKSNFIREYLWNNLKIWEIAKKYGCCDKTVSDYLKKHNAMKPINWHLERKKEFIGYICPECKKDLPIHRFAYRGDSRSHRSTFCLLCISKRRYKKIKKEKLLKYKRDWLRKYRAKIRNTN